MTYAALLNTLELVRAAVRRRHVQRPRARRAVKKHDAIAFDNLFSGDQSSMGAAAYIVAPLTYLMGNDYEKVEVEGLELTIGSTEEPRTATLERVWLDDPRPRAGRTVPLKVLLRTYRGEDVVRTLPIEIPANASGTLSVLVSDGARLAQVELREARLAAAAQRRPGDPVAEQGAAQQHALRQAARLRGRRGRQRRGAVVAAAVGARACSRPTGTAATSTRCTARRSANGSCRPSTPSAASRTLTISVSPN